MKQFLLLVAAMLFACCSADNETKAETPSAPAAPANASNGKTLVAYYSYTGDSRRIMNELTQQLQADVVEITPVDKTQRYEANNYAVGNQLLNDIKAGNYPAIDPVGHDAADYDNIIVVTPLWHSQMAAIMQTYLHDNSEKMAGKNMALIVSSHSSGISGVVNDAKHLLPNVTWMGDALWINNSNRSRTASLIENWLKTLNFKQSNMESNTVNMTIDGVTHAVALADNAATQALVAKLNEGPVSVSLNTNGDFEIWGPLGFSLPTSNEWVDGQPGDVLLYSGSNICIFYGTNSYNYTRLGKLSGLSAGELKSFLKGGQSNIAVTLSLPSGATKVNRISSPESDNRYYSLSGQPVEHPTRGIYIKKGKKVVM
jgi:flavodoxin